MSPVLERIHVLHASPAWLSPHERIVLYGLVAGLQPERTLEIGTFQGGSTLIMCAALDDLGKGTIMCVDPDPRVAPEHWSAVEHRATMVAEPSPQGVTTARRLAGGPFDFAFIDGDHSLEGVRRDIDATVAVLAPEAHLLFHDAHWHEVRDGIDEAIARRPGRLHDAGMVSVDHSTVEDPPGEVQTWGGMRLLRWTAG